VPEEIPLGSIAVGRNAEVERGRGAEVHRWRRSSSWGDFYRGTRWKEKRGKREGSGEENAGDGESRKDVFGRQSGWKERINPRESYPEKKLNPHSGSPFPAEAQQKIDSGSFIPAEHSRVPRSRILRRRWWFLVEEGS
jgi:hypothetical protein